MKLILNRRKRVKRNIKLTNLWYIVDNIVPYEPMLIRKEFRREELAKEFIKRLRLSTWLYDVIPGAKAIKYDLKFIPFGTPQRLPRVYVRDYIYPEDCNKYASKKLFRNRQRRKANRFKRKIKA